MSTVSTPHYHYSNNILSCGYIREHGNIMNLFIASDIQRVISMYSRQHKVIPIGGDPISSSYINDEDTEQIKQYIGNIDDVYVNGNGLAIKSSKYRNQLYINTKCVTIKNTEIQLLSSSVKNEKDLFIYTANNLLYKSSITPQLKQSKIMDKHSSFSSVLSCLTQIDTHFLKHLSLPFADSIIDIKCGKEHTLFLTKYGNVFSQGSNDSGQCGLENKIIYTGNNEKEVITHIKTPTLMQQNIIQIECGPFHNLLITSNHQVMVCGHGYCGELGLTKKYIYQINKEIHVTKNNKTDTDLPNFNNFTSSDSGDSLSIQSQKQQQQPSHIYHNNNDNDIPPEFEMILSSDSDEENDEDLSKGFAFQYDDDDDNKNEISNDKIYVPVLHPYFKDIVRVLCGHFHSLCISSSGECYSFGSNTFGNLGNGGKSEYGVANPIPQRIQMNHCIIDGSCGENHSLLLTKSNKIIAFGDNSYQQCSKINEFEEHKILKPFIISKESELGLSSNSFVEKVVCNENQSLIFIDEYSRC